MPASAPHKQSRSEREGLCYTVSLTFCAALAFGQWSHNTAEFSFIDTMFQRERVNITGQSSQKGKSVVHFDILSGSSDRFTVSHVCAQSDLL